MNSSTTSSPINTNKLKIKLENLYHKVLMPLLTPDSYLSKRVTDLANRAENIKWQKRLQKDGIPDVSKIFTYTNQNELRKLYELASNCPSGSVALEIGSHLGASSCYIAAGLKQNNGHLLCVDTWGNETMIEGRQDTYLEFHKNTSGVKQQITTIRKRSDDVVENDIKTQLNLVFIDGDHSYQAVKKDFETVQKWMTEDGIIAFHDFNNINFEGVSRVVGEALSSGKWVLVGKVDTLAWIKPARWEEPTWL
jgi:predicted O-methyltransferase YrrM